MERDRVTAEVRCPYCGMVQKALVDARAPGRVTPIYCDCDEGGCDRLFIAKVTILIKTETYQVNIDDSGEQVTTRML